MVSFTCNYCQDVVKKPKVVSHANMCGSANFTCVDCMEVFDLHTIKTHTSCVTETEKYQGKWRQKTANNFSNNNNNNSAVSRKRSSNDSDDDDDNDEKEKQKRHILRPPRAPMHFDSDDDDDDSWVRSKPQSAAKPNGHNAETSEKSPKTRSRIESSPNNNAKTEEEEEDEAAALAKKSGDGNGKMKPLPRAMTAADCVVPSFVLGTDDEIAQVAGWVFDEAGQSALDMKTLSKKMVERYNARIAKHVRSALEAAVAKGKLRLRQADGLVTMH